MRKILIIFILFIPLLLTNSVSASSDYIKDDANIYTSSQKISLLEAMNEITDEYDIDVYLITFETLTGNQQSAAIKYSNSFIIDIYGNYNVEAIVIIIDSNYGNSYGRWVEISTYGSVGNVLSSNDCYNLTSPFSSVGSGNLYNPTLTMITNMKSEIKTSLLMNKLIPHIIILVISLAVASLVVVSLIFNRGAQKTVSNYTYMDKNTGSILGRYDRYMRTTVVRTPRSSGGSGSGGRSGGGGRSSGGGRGF